MLLVVGIKVIMETIWLPLDVICLTSTWLSNVTDFCSMRLVCRHWARVLLKQPLWWRVIHTPMTAATTTTLADFSYGQRKYYLQNINIIAAHAHTLHINCTIWDLLSNFTDQFPAVQFLHISMLDENLTEQLHCFPQLKQIIFDHWDGDMEALSRWIGYLPLGLTRDWTKIALLAPTNAEFAQDLYNRDLLDDMAPALARAHSDIPRKASFGLTVLDTSHTGIRVPAAIDYLEQARVTYNVSPNHRDDTAKVCFYLEDAKQQLRIDCVLLNGRVLGNRLFDACMCNSDTFSVRTLHLTQGIVPRTGHIAHIPLSCEAFRLTEPHVELQKRLPRISLVVSLATKAVYLDRRADYIRLDLTKASKLQTLHMAAWHAVGSSISRVPGWNQVASLTELHVYALGGNHVLPPCIQYVTIEKPRALTVVAPHTVRKIHLTHLRQHANWTVALAQKLAQATPKKRDPSASHSNMLIKVTGSRYGVSRVVESCDDSKYVLEDTDLFWSTHPAKYAAMEATPGQVTVSIDDGQYSSSSPPQWIVSLRQPPPVDNIELLRLALGQ